MARAIWNGTVIAESNDTVIVEGNHYFPESSIHSDYFRDSSYETTCGWKGTASYKSIEVDGQVNENAAWYYPTPKPEADQIRGRYAFWKGVDVQGNSGPDQAPDGATCSVD